MDLVREPVAADAIDDPRGARYRVFFQTPDGHHGNCEIARAEPITADDVDGIERELLAAFGHSNVLVIGWQRLARPDAPAAGRAWSPDGSAPRSCALDPSLAHANRLDRPMRHT